MLRVSSTVRDGRAMLEITHTAPDTLTIRDTLLVRSGAFKSAYASEELLGSLINIPPGGAKYLDVTDALLRLFDVLEGETAKDMVWLAFILDGNPAGRPSPFCFTVDIQGRKITSFDLFVLAA